MTWKAAVGSAGANGTATITAPASAGTAGSLRLALKGLAASTLYPVKIVRGTCAAPGAVLYSGPAQRSTSAGRIAKTLAIPAAKMSAIRVASAVALRVGSGTKLRCGPFAGGPAPSPTATPTPLAATIGAQADVGGLTGIAADDASVWVNALLEPTVYRLDPSTATVSGSVDFKTTIGSPMLTFNDRPAIGFGSLWVPTLDFSGPASGGYVIGKAALVRIDTTSAAVSAKVVLGGTMAGPAASGEGSIWALSYGPSSLVRVDPATNAITRTVALPISPDDVAIGPGAAWVTGGGKLLRIDAATYAITTLDLAEARGVAVADGSVLVGTRPTDTASARLVKVDIATMAVTSSVEVPGSPIGLAAGGGYAWLAPGDEKVPTAIAVSISSMTIAATVTLPGDLGSVAIRGRSAWFAGTAVGAADVVRVDY